MAAKVEKKFDTLIKLCGLYRNISKQTGREYFAGTLSFSTKLLILQNRNAKTGEPPWTLYLAPREQKPARRLGGTALLPGIEDSDEIPDPGWPTRDASAE